jgi:hypothetical protein
MVSDFGLSKEEVPPIVRKLVERGRITVVTSAELNPYIKRFRDQPKSEMLELLKAADIVHVCAYPSRSHLRRVVKPKNYKGRPFTMELALGEPQLAYRVFDLNVLEFYRNDPRYDYYTDDIGGHISVRAVHARKMRKEEQSFLESFGFAYDKQHYRAVAVFLRYLARMTPEHQQIWNAKRIRRKYGLHPDYYRSSIVGDWPKGISVLAASIEEMTCVNELCKL